MLVEFGAVSILNYQTFTTAIFQEYEMAFNNNTAALLSGVLMVICILVVMGEIRFRGTQTLYQSGKGVIRPYPLKTLSAGKQILAVSFFTTIFMLSIGVPITMLIYWLTVGSSLKMRSILGNFLPPSQIHWLYQHWVQHLPLFVHYHWYGLRYAIAVNWRFGLIESLIYFTLCQGLLSHYHWSSLPSTMRIRFIKPLPWLSSPTLCFIFQWRKRPCVARLNKCLVTLKR